MPGFGGKLASVSPSPGVNTFLYSPGKIGFKVTISITNRNEQDVKIRLAIIDSETDDINDLVEDDWIEYDVTLRSNGIIERSNVSLKNRNSVIVYADTSNVNFAIWG